MNKIAMKFQAGAAAVAIAGAAALTPMSTAQAAPVAPAPSTTQVMESNVLFQRDQVQMELTCALFGLICAGDRNDLSPHQVILEIPFLGFLLGDLAICTLGFSIKGNSYTGGLAISAGSSC